MLAALLAYLLASLWPVNIAPETIGHEPQNLRLLWSGVAFEITADLQLALFAGIFGGVGSLAHAMAQAAAARWHLPAPSTFQLAWHLLSPLFGVAAALLFHAVMRSSVLADSVGAGRLDTIGLAIHGLLAGLLSKPAFDRLGDLLPTRLHRRQAARSD